MKSKFLIAAASVAICVASAQSFAGGNVKLVATGISQVSFRDRALNHPEYSEISINGSISRSDAVVEGLPNPAPQTIRLLVKRSAAQDSTLAICKDMAMAAKATKGTFVLNLFFDKPDNLVKKIEGGMAQADQNEFVIRTDDSEISSVGCSLGM